MDPGLSTLLTIPRPILQYGIGSILEWTQRKHLPRNVGIPLITTTRLIANDKRPHIIILLECITLGTLHNYGERKAHEISK